MRELFARLSRVAQSSAAVLIEGETGTGKELAARTVHDASPRAGVEHLFGEVSVATSKTFPVPAIGVIGRI
jgi:DNA-binding NtrC family response regulator